MKKYTIIYLSPPERLREDKFTNPLHFDNNGQPHISVTLTMVEGLIHPEQMVRKQFEKLYEKGNR